MDADGWGVVDWASSAVIKVNNLNAFDGWVLYDVKQINGQEFISDLDFKVLHHTDKHGSSIGNDIVIVECEARLQ